MSSHMQSTDSSTGWEAPEPTDDGVVLDSIESALALVAEAIEEGLALVRRRLDEGAGDA